MHDRSQLGIAETGRQAKFCISDSILDAGFWIRACPERHSKGFSMLVFKQKPAG
jgi:hypothetical protein